MQITIRQKNSILAAHLSERGRKGHCTPHIDLSAVFGQWNDVLIPTHMYIRKREREKKSLIDYSAL